MLLIAVVLTAIADFLHWSPTWITIIAAVGIVPVARLMGESTEHISAKVGPAAGALMNATFGNAAELIIAIFALKAGLIDVVKASITGSIIGNVLLVLGAAMLAGGIQYKEQHFNKHLASGAVTSLALVSFSLMMPAALTYAAGSQSTTDATRMSLAIAIVLMLMYFLNLFYQLKTHVHLMQPVEEEVDSHPGLMVAGWSLKKSILMLLLATAAVVFLSENLVGSIEQAAKTAGLTPVFVGVILLAIIGNAAENSTAILMARKNKMDLSLNIVLSSSTQIAMFVAPIIVIAGFLFGQPMDFRFSLPEIIAVFASMFLMSLIVNDGTSTWEEGAKLLGLYTVIAITFFFIHR